MTRVRWFPEARDNVRAARQYIARDNPTAAKQTAKRIRDAVKGLATYPHMGREGRVAGTRELVVPATSYIVVYRLRAEIVEILTVLHGAQEYP